MQALKRAAIDSGLTLREFVIAKLTEAVSGKIKQETSQATATAKSKRKTPGIVQRSVSRPPASVGSSVCASRPSEERATIIGDKRCKHGFPTCNSCGFKDGAKVHG
jgi:hypothetical protein